MALIDTSSCITKRILKDPIKEGFINIGKEIIKVKIYDAFEVVSCALHNSGKVIATYAEIKFPVEKIIETPFSYGLKKFFKLPIKTETIYLHIKGHLYSGSYFSEYDPENYIEYEEIAETEEEARSKKRFPSLYNLRKPMFEKDIDLLKKEFKDQKRSIV